MCSCNPQGHLLWNAGRTLATHLEKNASSLIHGKTILELGAGAGLPSLVAAINGETLEDEQDEPALEGKRPLLAASQR